MPAGQPGSCRCCAQGLPAGSHPQWISRVEDKLFWVRLTSLNLASPEHVAAPHRDTRDAQLGRAGWPICGSRWPNQRSQFVRMAVEISDEMFLGTALEARVSEGDPGKTSLQVLASGVREGNNHIPSIGRPSRYQSDTPDVLTVKGDTVLMNVVPVEEQSLIREARSSHFDRRVIQLPADHPVLCTNTVGGRMWSDKPREGR